MRHSIFFLISLLTYFATSAQERETVIVRKYTQKDGINSYNVRRVTQDEFGFLWIAAQDGLSRYDGRNFTTYSKTAPARRRIAGIDIREVIPDTTSHLLWVLSGEDGFDAINTVTGEVVKSVHIPASNNEDWNICMTKHGATLWIGTFTGLKVFNIKTNRFEQTPFLQPDPTNSDQFEIRSILADHNGNIWVAYTGYGIVIYDGTTKNILAECRISRLNAPRKSRAIRFLYGVETQPGKILYATDQGLRRIARDTAYRLTPDNNPCKTVPRLNNDETDALVMRNKSLLIAGAGTLFQFDTQLKTYKTLEEHNGFTDSKWLNTIQCLFSDKNDNLWLGCEMGLGFIGSKKSPFDAFSFDATSNTRLDQVEAIYPLPNGDLLVGLMNGLVRVRHTDRTFKRYDDAHLYNHIFNDMNGRILVSRRNGLFVFNQNSKLAPVAQVYPEFSAFSHVSINSQLYIGDSLMILGTENNQGILCWNIHRRNIVQIKKGAGADSLSSNIVNNIYRDSAKNIWILSDNVISILSPDLQKNKEILLPHKLFFDMCEAGGYYWIASYGSGLLALDKSGQIKKEVNTGNGLADDGVYQIFRIGNDKLLVTTNNGITLLDIKTAKCSNFYVRDGLQSNEFEEVSGARDESIIYAGGLDGFTAINTKLFNTNNTPPRIYFAGIKTECKGFTLDTSNLLMQSLSIPNTWLQTSIRFAGLNFSRPEGIRYKYRIPEQDSSWINLGTTDFLNLMGLPPGSYTIEAKAANEEGYWSGPISLTLHIQPRWYETVLFRIAIAFLVLSLLYIFYRWRISELQKQQKIRSGIASDLHDDIGSILTSVKTFSHLARIDPFQNEHFDNINESLGQATVGLRDMIWVLDNSEDTIYELIERIKKYASPLTTASGIKFGCIAEISGKNSSISKTAKRNLLLIAKEAINNSVKYAACTEITVHCEMRSNKFRLTIADNGKGFHLQTPSYGNGLRNMSERARQMRCYLDITSAPGKGTCIKVLKT